MFVLSPELMRRIDAAAIEAGTPSLVLMERAGLGATRSILERADWLWGTTLVVCGKGNNGGDGFVVARLLQGEGHPVRVLCLAPASELSSDARTNLDRAQARGVRVEIVAEEPVAALWRAHRELPGRLIIDAVLGTGFTPPLRKPLDALCGAIGELGRRVVALDGPTGLDGSTGHADENSPFADLTLCLGFPKWGNVLAPGRALCGRLERIDLELSRELVEAEIRGAEGVALYVDRVLASGWWRPRAIDAHKYDAGAVLAVGASDGMSGAIALACNAAYRTGAGLVEAVVPGSSQRTVDTLCVESLVHAGPETETGGLGPGALDLIVERLQRKRALLLGPGGGADLATAQLFVAAMERIETPMVVDADALNALHRLQARIDFRQRAVLTPHSGELKRLLAVDAAELASDRRGVLLKAARDWRAVFVHKGAPTFVAAPDGSLAVIGSGGPGLATAGSGDVLSGCIAALLAQGHAPFEAACLGAYLHGRAGDLLEKRRGVAGILARELCDEIAAAAAEVERDHR